MFSPVLVEKRGQSAGSVGRRGDLEGLVVLSVGPLPPEDSLSLSITRLTAGNTAPDGCDLTGSLPPPSLLPVGDTVSSPPREVLLYRVTHCFLIYTHTHTHTHTRVRAQAHTHTHDKGLIFMTLGRQRFLNRTQIIKEKIDKLDYDKVRNFCSSKDTIKKEKKKKKASYKVAESTCIIHNQQRTYFQNIEELRAINKKTKNPIKN